MYSMFKIMLHSTVKSNSPSFPVSVLKLVLVYIYALMPFIFCIILIMNCVFFPGKLGNFGELAMTNFGVTQVDKSGKQKNSDNETHVAKPPFRMESIDRVSKLPVVEELMKLATNLYGKFRVSVYHANTGKALVAKVKLF